MHEAPSPPVEGSSSSAAVRDCALENRAFRIGTWMGGPKGGTPCYWNIGSMSRQLAPEPRYFSALNGRRRRGAHKARLELLAMGSVVDPLARRGDPLAGNHRGVADDSGQVAVAPRLDAFSAS